MSNWMGTLPSGEVTVDEREYVTAWRELARKIEPLFPGFRVGAYDPGLLFFKDGARSIDLSTLEANAMAALIDDYGELLKAAEPAVELLRDSAEGWDNAYHHTGEKSARDQASAYDACAEQLRAAIARAKEAL